MDNTTIVARQNYNSGGKNTRINSYIKMTMILLLGGSISAGGVQNSC